MPQGRPMMAKLFLEGKEVPFIGATITSAVNQASIAYIDVVPHELINNVAPRTHVSIQVRDYQDATVGSSGAGTEDGFPYVEAWEGEVFGFNFGKTPSSRSFTLQCIDYSSYWDNVLTYFFDPAHTLSQGGTDVIDGTQDIKYAQDSGSQTIPVTRSDASFFKTTIDNYLANNEGANFLDGLIEVLREITKVNTFYNSAQSRLRINDRILLQSSGSLDTLLNYGQQKDWLFDVVNKTSGFVSLRGVVQDLLSIIFHDYATVPFPARVTKNIKNPLKSANNQSKTIGNFIFKPNLYTIPPPMCNVFYPDEYSSFQFNRNFFKEPTRLLYYPKMPVVLTKQTLSLPLIAQPPSLREYLFGTGDNPCKGDGATEVSGTDQGHMGQVAPPPYNESSARKRLGQFLTNEEKLKGIWTAMESTMPAATQFATKVDETYQVEFLNNIAKYFFYKKRFESRSLQITSHLKLSVVPGFNVLILDDSSADQNVLAYCSSVTHRIYATEGGYTNVILSYARTYKEEDQASQNDGSPIVPPWFASSIFGRVQDATSQADPKLNGKKLVVTPPALSDFYKTLLGDLGSKALTNYDPKEQTVIGAVKKLLADYREAKSKGVESVQNLIKKTTARDYVRCRDTYRFLGATNIPADIRPAFTEFSGGQFIDWTKRTKVPDDQRPQYLRQLVVRQYRDALRTQRGFRG